MLQGVKWLDLFENARWFGLDAQRAFYQEELLASIEATVKILIENRDFQNDPLPNQDPLTIIDSSFLEKVYVSGVFGTEQASYENPLERKFPLLKDSQWEILSVVGSLKFRNVTFLSGTFDLDFNGQEQLDASIEILKHYPNFRIVVKGHTGTRGDPEANKALSQERANSAKEYFVQTYNMDLNRIRTIGAGGSEPLKKRDGESSRSYNDRLKRVEVYIVSP
ncbi:MAG TPA: OmpA family protein [Spirochaetales bacterium]|nr:OmpA family protein [Spirochaetales bacterium]